MSQLDQTIRYTIRLEGSVDATLADWYGAMQIAHDRGADGRPITTLAGEVTDQAALVGLVRHLHGLGLVLLAVERRA